MKKKQKCRKLSIRYKLLIPACIMVGFICAILGLNSYIAVNNGMVSVAVDEAGAIAAVAADEVDAALLPEAIAQGEGSEAYAIIQEELASLKEACKLPYLYTLYADGQNVYYGVDTDLVDHAAIGDIYETPYEELADLFEKGNPYLTDYIAHLEYGDLITAFYPIKNDQGQVVGAIGCDYDASSVTQRINTTMNRVLGITLVCLVLFIILINIVMQFIMKNLKSVDDKLYDLVHNEGDLTQKLDVKSGDEMELIALNVNELLEYIRAIMLNISANSNSLNGSSKAVVQNLSDAQMSITNVSSTMEQMSAAMEETNASLNQINESIQETYSSIEDISQQAVSGSESSHVIMQKAANVYNEAVEAQQAAKVRAQQMAEAVSDKIAKSRAVEQIGALTSNIINITDETSLLALNASIEAARAGEAGRGFAVVADQIGTLATNSAAAATEIQRVSDEVIMAVNELATEAQDMIQFLDETTIKGYQNLLETSDSYRSDVGNMNAMLQNFAQKSEQIKINMDSIRESVDAVNIAVEESTLGVNNVTEMSVDLSTSVGDIGEEANSNMDIANQLNTEVNRFKL